MPTPIEFAIVKDVQAALAAITTSDGYYFDVKPELVKLDPNHDVDELVEPDGQRPYIVILPFPPEGSDEWAYQRAGTVELTLPMTVFWSGESDPTRDESRIETFLQGCADVERALTRDLSRGERAIDTRIVRRSAFVDGAQVVAAIELQVRFLRTYGEPNA